MTTADVLNGAADLLDELPHARVVRTDVHLALRHAAPSYEQARDALLAVWNHLRRTGADSTLLDRWYAPQHRHDAAELMRAAAHQLPDGSTNPVRSSQ